MSVVRVLHLSDFHFGAGHYFGTQVDGMGRQPLSRAVAKAVEAHLPSGATVDIAVMSGDFFTTDSGNEIPVADEILNDLLDRLDRPKVLLVPGNHDVNWEADLPTRRFYHFDTLAVKLGCAECQKEVLPAIAVADADATRVVVVALDSCKVDSADYPGVGYLALPQIDAAVELLSGVGSPDNTLMIAVLHHHLLPVSSSEISSPDEIPRKASFTIDAVRVLDNLSLAGVRVFLHGHQHRSAILKLGNPRWGPNRQVVVAGAASCGGDFGSTARGFQLIEADAQNWTLTLFEQANDPEEFKVGETFTFQR